MQLRPGTVLEGRYVVEGLLGEGGMARVWRVRHARLDSHHALKVLHAPGPALRRRLMLEGQVQGALRHPHVVAVTDVVDVDGCPGLVMELVTGPPLSRLLQTRRLSLDQVDQLARGILAGTAAAHAAGLVHRDLKPDNVLLAVHPDGVVPKVTDFGLAKLEAPASPSMTRSGVTMGSPAYMAPEQIRNARDVDARADVHALGVLLYEMATGIHPFDEPDLITLFDRIAHGRRAPVQEVAPELPERMASTIERALQVAPADRFPDAGALLAAWCDGAPATSGDAWPVHEIEGALSLAPVLPTPQAETGLTVALGSTLDADMPEATARRRRWPLVLGVVVAAVAAVAVARLPPGPVDVTHELVALRLPDADSDAALQQAWRALTRADLLVATRDLLRLVAAHPDRTEPRLLLYVALLAQSRPGSAEQILFEPGWEPAGSGHAAQMARALRGGEAQRREWAREHPDDLLYLLASSSERVSELWPELPLGWLLRVRRRTTLRDLDGAHDALERLDALAPDNGWAAYERAVIHLRRQEFEAAREGLVALVRRDPGLVAARSLLAVVLLYEGQHELSDRYAEAMSDPTVAPDEQVAFASQYANALIGVGRLDEARATLSRGADIAEEHGLRSDLARLLLLEFTLEDISGPYPPETGHLERLRAAATAPDLPEPVRGHLSTGLLALEGETAAARGDVAQALEIAARLERLRSPFVGRVQAAVEIAAGDLSEVAVGTCITDWMNARILRHHGHHAEALASLERVLRPGACAHEGIQRACLAMAAAAVAEASLEGGRTDQARSALRQAKGAWTRPDPDQPAARSMAAVEAALGGGHESHRTGGEGSPPGTR